MAYRLITLCFGALGVGVLAGCGTIPTSADDTSETVSTEPSKAQPEDQATADDTAPTEPSETDYSSISWESFEISGYEGRAVPRLHCLNNHAIIYFSDNHSYGHSVTAVRMPEFDETCAIHTQ